MNRVVWNTLFFLSLGMASPAIAGNLTVPNSFAAGTPAVASEVNANFTAVESAVDDNDSRVTTLEGTVSNNDSRITVIEGTVPNKVDVGGDTMTGDLVVPRIGYSSPRIHYVAISGDAFRPRTSTVAYTCSSGCWISTASSTERLIATASLPHGARVTGFTVYFHDNDASNDLEAIVYSQLFTMAAYYQIATTTTITSTGSSTSVQTVPATLVGSYYQIDNRTNSIVVNVGPASGSTWSSTLRIQGVSIEYYLIEAQ